MNLIAQNSVGELIGTITPIGPITGDPIAGLSSLLVFGIRLFLFVVALVVFFYLLWGAFDWVTSGGDKEKVSKAQQKLTYAIFGLILVFVIFAVYAVVAGDMLGILKRNSDGSWYFNVPTFDSPNTPTPTRTPRPGGQ